ncbi:class A beta-lactamase [Pseudonocardia broussonetiae]|uniref:Beta-lactamase n=1 Tax=Pseudonocardia broussonetiae TaxID=2736640 RepID=A0A6M6JFG0_9PSEU|nr:class A beta-lactamase [Pseudonocardia broussonetiae]QJY45109.1 class A beta-lactamase [Pseudonocardia broussonetiae]
MTTIGRRTLLVGLGAAVAGCAAPAPDPTPPPSPVGAGLEQIERRFGGRLGVFALDTGSGAVVSHRGDERFLLASTGKAFIAAAVLQRAAAEPALLDRVIQYDASALIANAPVAERNLATGMTVAALGEAAITHSDNTAANLLFDLLGGPAAVTGFVRGTGDATTRFDRLEPDLNVSTGPDDERDTSTPAAVVATLRAVTLGDGLDPAGRDRLTGWLLANTTGDATIRAGAPAGWRVGDKTGTGGQGERNDIAVLYPPDRAPILLAVYTAPADPEAEPSNETVAEATRAVVAALA